MEHLDHSLIDLSPLVGGGLIGFIPFLSVAELV